MLRGDFVTQKKQGTVTQNVTRTHDNKLIYPPVHLTSMPDNTGLHGGSSILSRFDGHFPPCFSLSSGILGATGSLFIALPLARAGLAPLERYLESSLPLIRRGERI